MARAELKTALELEPQASSPRLVLGALERSRAEWQLAHGARPEAALEAARVQLAEAARVNANDPSIRVERARVEAVAARASHGAASLRSLSLARSLIEEALKENPRNRDALKLRESLTRQESGSGLTPH